MQKRNRNHFVLAPLKLVPVHGLAAAMGCSHSRSLQPFNVPLQGLPSKALAQDRNSPDGFPLKPLDEAILSLLKEVQPEVLPSLDLPQLEVISSIALRRSYEAGSTVVQQGELYDSLYIVESGDAEVLCDGKRLGSLGPRQHFGGRALRQGAAQPAEITIMVPAAEGGCGQAPLQCVRISAASFCEALGPNACRIAAATPLPMPAAEAAAAAAAEDATAPIVWFYVDSKRERQGPMRRHTLIERLEGKAPLPESTLVWTPPMEQWHQLDGVAELTSARAARAARARAKAHEERCLALDVAFTAAVTASLPQSLVDHLNLAIQVVAEQLLTHREAAASALKFLVTPALAPAGEPSAALSAAPASAAAASANAPTSGASPAPAASAPSAPEAAANEVTASVPEALDSPASEMEQMALARAPAPASSASCTAGIEAATLGAAAPASAATASTSPHGVAAELHVFRS